MELGEDIYQTVTREVKEETNLEIHNLKLFNVYSGKGQHYIYPNGDEAYFVNVIFETNSYNGNLKMDSESVKLNFFDVDKIPGDVTPTFNDILKDLVNRR